MSYCTCTDLVASAPDKYWSGPQCQYETSIDERIE